MYFLHIIQFSFFLLDFEFSFITIFIAISSPSSIDPHEVTGCLCMDGSKYPESFVKIESMDLKKINSYWIYMGMKPPTASE